MPFGVGAQGQQRGGDLQVLTVDGEHGARRPVVGVVDRPGHAVVGAGGDRDGAAVRVVEQQVVVHHGVPGRTSTTSCAPPPEWSAIHAAARPRASLTASRLRGRPRSRSTAEARVWGKSFMRGFSQWVGCSPAASQSAIAAAMGRPVSSSTQAHWPAGLSSRYT